MAEVMISLLPFIIGSAVVPLQIIMVILLLTGETQGPLKAVAFVLGMTLARLAQGVLFGLVLTGGEDGADTTGETGWIKSTLLLVLGLLLLITAYRNWANHPDPDAPPPRWLTMLETVTPVTALGMGAGLVLIGAKLWVFTLGAIGTIGEAALGQPESTIAFVLYVLLAESLLIIPILIRLLFPTRAGALLGSFNNRLEAHSRLIVIVVSLVFGLLFTYQGISALF